jgi:hypothetical protein
MRHNELRIFVAKHAPSKPWVVWDGETFHTASNIICSLPFETEDRGVDGPVARYCLVVVGKIQWLDFDVIRLTEV